MITVQTAESALRNIYLDAVAHEINTKTNPFLTMVQKNTKTVATGEARVGIRYGNDGSVIASTEDGVLPTPTGRHVEIIEPLKNIFGTFEVTDKALKAAQNNPGAFSALVGDEMQNLVSSAKNSINRMIFGSGENLEMNGIDSIFASDMLYNLVKSDHQEILPFHVSLGSGTHTPISESLLVNFIDELEAHTKGQSTDIIMVNPEVRRALFTAMQTERVNVDVTEFEGGFRGFSFNGIPMYADHRCLPGSVYALNANSYAMHQLCDWTWMEGDDGSILKRDANRPTLRATLVKYGDLICEKPFLQGKLTGFVLGA